MKTLKPRAAVGMGIPMGIPMVIPVGMGWVWGLKCHPHGSPVYYGPTSSKFVKQVKLKNILGSLLNSEQDVTVEFTDELTAERTKAALYSCSDVRFLSFSSRTIFPSSSPSSNHLLIPLICMLLLLVLLQIPKFLLSFLAR